LVGSSRIKHISSIGLFYKNKARGGGGLSDCEKLVGPLKPYTPLEINLSNHF